NYEQHISATKQRIMFCQEPTECMICMGEAAAGETVILMECLHTFCKDCLEQHVLLNENAIVCCPYIDDDYECPSQIQQREIQALISPDDFEKFLSRSLSLAERQTSNSYHCQYPNCPGWCEYDDTVNVFVCPVCKVENCLTCKAIHEGVSCLVYQEKLQNTATNDKSSKQTKNLLQRLVKTKDAMHCPQCNIIIQKMKGCDWVRCSMCKTEICWVTKGPRWGPGGRGDISGGCRCNVDGRKCHRKCNNCH
uniref:RBR-type E3 ubiquitin transferase n=1 Tax=Ciona savignyi TaxID=51511 RepID=H2ZD14_CIOSA